MKKEYLIVGVALVAAYFLLRSSTAVAGVGNGSIIINGRTYTPDASGYYRNDDGGVTRWYT